MKPAGPGRVLALGALTIALLDGLDAVIFSRIRGVGAGRMFQSIASGLLGRSAYEGGAATIALGVTLHTFIASVVIVTYYVAATRRRELAGHPFVFGPLYGVAVYLVMNLIVLPLSAIGPRRPSTVAIVNGLLIHVAGVGLPAALFTRAALARAEARRTEDSCLHTHSSPRI